MSLGVRYVKNSGNSKISGTNKVDATYVSIKSSCPKDCSLMGKGCYAENSYTGIHVRRLDEESYKLSSVQVARQEAQAIKESYNYGQVPPNRDLRLHVSGDSRTVKGTRLIDNAVAGWKARGGRDCWTYTHAWKHVHRSEWSNVSTLASVNNISEVTAARRQGYAPAILVPEHPSNKAYKLKGSSVKWIPCPNQTRGVSCVDCRLCMRSDYLYSNNVGIAFSAHGVKKNLIKRRLSVIQ